MKIKAIASAVVLAAVSLSAPAMAAAAAPTTVGELAAGTSFSDVGLAILAIAGALITLAVVKKGARQVLGFIGR